MSSVITAISELTATLFGNWNTVVTDNADQHDLPTPSFSAIAIATMSQLSQKNLSKEAATLPAQPTAVNEPAELGPHVTRATIPPSSPRGSGTGTPSIGSTLSTRESILAAHLDITPSLQKAIHSVVKARNGSVLSRGSILKTDHYPSGERFNLFRGQENRRGFIGWCSVLCDQR